MLWGATKVSEIVNRTVVEGVKCHEASPVPGPESGGAFVGVAGAPPLRLATFAKTAWNVVSERANPSAESACRTDMFSAKMVMRRNGRVNKRKPSDLRSVVRILAMGPHLIESAHCRTSALRVKGMEPKRGQASLSPFRYSTSWAYWMAANISLIWGVFSFLSAFASIWRIRSLVTERLCPTCSSVQA